MDALKELERQRWATARGLVDSAGPGENMRSPSPALRVITAYAAALLVGVGLNLHDGPAKAGPYVLTSPAAQPARGGPVDAGGPAKADHSPQPSALSPPLSAPSPHPA